MVGRLIEKENIRFGDQEFTECDTGLLTTGKSGNLFIEIFFCEAETVQNTHKLAFVGVTVLKLKFMSQTGIGIHQAVKLLAGSVFHLNLHGAKTVLHINDVLFGAEKFFIYRKMTLHILILCKVTNALVFCKNDLSGIGVQLVHDNAEQSGLAGTVVSDQSCFFTLFYMKRGIFQNHLFAEGFGNALT